MNDIIGLGIVGLTSILLLAFTLIKRKSPALFRDIPALTRLRRAAGLAVEDGTRLHISLGRGGLLTPRGAGPLAGLALLRGLAEQASVSDRPPVVTSGEGVLSALSQDTLESAYRAAGAEEMYQPVNGRASGLTPFSYAAGAMPITRDEYISTTVLLGDFGPEAALLADAAERDQSLLVAGASDPAAQAVLFASASDPLIGEEMFAAPAYLNADAAQRASISVQDILRWLIILALLGLSAMKFLGIV